MRIDLLLILGAGLCSAQDLSKSIGISASTDSGLQIWANSTSLSARTATVLGNAAVFLGGLFLLYNSDEVLAAADLLLPPNLKPVGLHHPSPELPKLPYSGVQPLPAFHPLPPSSAPIYIGDVREVLEPLEPWNLGHRVGETWGKVKALTKNQMARMKALTQKQMNKIKALTRGRPGAIFNLASMAQILPDSVNKVREAGKLPLRLRQRWLTALRPTDNLAVEKEAAEEFDMEEQEPAPEPEPEHKPLDMDMEKLPFLIFPRMKDRIGEEKEMVEEMVAPEDKKNNIPPATKSFEDRFRDEDEELQELIVAHLSNFESFKIPKAVEEESMGLGSNISAPTVEEVLGTSPDDEMTTTQMSVVNEREKEDTDEEDNKDGRFEEGLEGEEEMLILPSNILLEEVLKKFNEDDDKLQNGEKLKILKEIAKAFIQRKYIQVEKHEREPRD